MTDIDQAGVIEQLMAENALLRETLRHSPDKEIQIAAALMMVIDELTRMGPNVSQRVLMWVFSRYGISQHIYARDIYDRRPKAQPVVEKTSTPIQPAAAPAEKLERRQALRQARVAAGLTQTALAQRAGMYASQISAIELGNTKPSEEIWTRLETAIKEAQQ